MWPKFRYSSISTKEIIMTSILWILHQKNQFFEECSWFKFNNLRLAQGMALIFTPVWQKFYDYRRYSPLSSWVGLNSTLIFELCYLSFGERIIFTVLRDLNFKFQNSLAILAMIVTVRPASIVKVFKIGWIINKFCDAS